MKFILAFSVLILFAGGLVFADQGDKVPDKASKMIDPGHKADEGQASDESDFVTVSSSAVSVSGDKAQFMQRYGISKDFSGGVEDFYMEKEPDKDTTIKLEGHGLFDVHDYKFKLGMDKKDIGHWDIGYTEFRTWYDGDGGFFPRNRAWFSLYDNDLHVDRGHAWFGGELTLPDLPVFGFKYDFETRRGAKDSTIWGDTNLTGGFGARNIVPSFHALDERRDTFDAYMKNTMGETDLKNGFKYETTANSDRLNIRMTPYEPTDRTSTQRDITSSDLFGFYGSSQTWFSENTLFSTAYSLSTGSSRIGGSDIYGPGYGATFDATFPNLLNNAYLDEDGNTQSKKTVVALNLMTVPVEDLTLTVGARPDYQKVDGVADYVGINPNGPLMAQGDTKFLNVSEQFEARYRGIKNWAFYARGDWNEKTGALMQDLHATDTGIVTSHYDSLQEGFNQKYTVGSNWYPLNNFNLGAQYYHLDHSTSYVTRNQDFTMGFLYPGAIVNQNMKTDDFNIRGTWRPWNNVTSVTRYEYQETRFDNQMLGLASQESGRNNQHIFGQTITWNPLTYLYFQGSADYSINRTEIPLNDYMGAFTESRNDYLTTSFTTGYALNDKTDLQLQYTYYFAPDYYDNSTSGMVYGSGAEDHHVTLSMIRRITKEIQWTVKYGFYRHHDQLFGGMEDYDAHLVYTGLNMKF